MIKSMTAHAQCSRSSSKARCDVEIHSVNKRFLDIHVSLPKDFAGLDMELKKHIAKKIARGSISVCISMDFFEGKQLLVTPDVALAKELKKAWRAMGGGDAHFDLLLVARERDLFTYEEAIDNEERHRELLWETVQEALNSLLLMKREEVRI